MIHSNSDVYVSSQDIELGSSYIYTSFMVVHVLKGGHVAIHATLTCYWYLLTHHYRLIILRIDCEYQEG